MILNYKNVDKSQNQRGLRFDYLIYNISTFKLKMNSKKIFVNSYQFKK